MKIALFTETYFPDINGVAAHVQTLKIGLEELGHKVLVVTANKKIKRHYLKDGILYCPSFESKRFYGFGIALPKNRRRSKFIADFDPDIIHIHHEFGIGLSGVAAAKDLDIPLVYTLHTMYDMYVHYVSSKRFSRFITALSHIYEKRLAEKATLLTSPSRKGEAYFNKIGVKDKEIYLVPNSADFESFHPGIISSKEKFHLRGKLRIPPKATIACFAGRMGGEKSVDVLLDFWGKSIKKEDNLHLLLIGDGPDKEELEKQALTLGILDMVSFAGRVEHEDMPKYFALSDLYITASLSEMNSISMLEGMATGLPVLQRYDLLNADQIQVNVNGWFFTNEAEMAEKLKVVEKKTTKEKQILKQQVRDSVSHRDTKGLAETLLKIYNRAIELKYELESSKNEIA